MAILPDRSALTAPADGDLYMTTDVSDTTDAATGTDKKITWANMKAAITTVGTLSAGNADAVVSNASSTTAGKVELAIATELLTETDTGRAVTPSAMSAYAGGANITHVGTLSAGNVDAAVTNSSSTAAGKVELATAAELVTGTDVVRAVTPGGMSAYAGGTNITKIGTLTAGNADAAVTNASSTAAGKVELATAAELVTGTDTGRAVTPGGMSAYAGGTTITKVGTLTAGNVNAVVTAATTSTAGKVELAIASEVNTGTDATRAITPDSLAGSNLGTKNIGIMVTNGSTAITTGDGKAYFRIPVELNGMDVVSVAASLTSPSTSGLPNIMIARGRQASATGAYNYVDVLSTAITIDANEYDSKDATTAAVINTSNDDLATGDLLRVDVDGVGTAPSATLSVNIGCRLP